MQVCDIGLGIDIGTTSVKTCLVNSNSKEVIALQKKDTYSDVPSEFGTTGNKQNVAKIISAVQMCVSRLPKEHLANVSRIGVCGQMHGCLLWKHGEAWNKNTDNERFEITKVSDLYTWQDNRCSSEFIRNLPKPTSHLGLASGYGCVTLIWFAKNKPELFQEFDRAATIQDFVVSVICDLDAPIMSTQNAASWGYFNTQKQEWDIVNLSSAGFPISCLPKVIPVGKCAGKLKHSWYGIPKGASVLAAFGDLQCSVYPLLKSPSDAAITISTSAQICFQLLKGFEPSEFPPEPPASVDYFPYFNGTYLAVAASLNGGNVLAIFVRMLQQWAIDLGFQAPQAKIWEKILSLGASEESTSELSIDPTVYGERHAPDRGASVCNIDAGNVSLAKTTRAMCKGLIENLHSMMPASLLKENGITQLIGGGSALTRNVILQKEVENVFKIPLVLSSSGAGACYGAALVALEAKDE